MNKNSVIHDGLSKFAKDKHINILYACESGSRAWGFASPDSDYDVRFIYIHPQDWYLSITDHKDTIDPVIEGELDFSGWDIRKTLFHFKKSNPTLLEWLQSGIVYLDNHGFAADLRNLTPDYYSPRRCLYHYLSMAKSQYMTHFKEEKASFKKYFYVIRPLFACRWIEAGLGPAPTEFQKLTKKVTPDAVMARTIEFLLERKKHSMEKDKDGRLPELDKFIESELERIKPDQFPDAREDDAEPLNRLLREYLEKAWKN
jgi:predicted nucleotidyltransferase